MPGFKGMTAAPLIITILSVVQAFFSIIVLGVGSSCKSSHSILVIFTELVYHHFALSIYSRHDEWQEKHMSQEEMSIEALDLLERHAVLDIMTIAYGGRATQWPFAVFTASWSILTIAILLFTACFTPDLEHPSIVLVLEFLTWVFWLTVWVASTNTLTHGILSGTKESIVALLVFGIIQWALFTYTLFVSYMYFLEYRRGGNGGGGSRAFGTMQTGTAGVRASKGKSVDAESGDPFKDPEPLEEKDEGKSTKAAEAKKDGKMVGIMVE